MDKTIRKYTSFDEAKADEYRYWQSRPLHERMDEVARLSLAMYATKGAGSDVPKLDKTLVRIERPKR
jgi:hypothetical protein